MRRYLILIVLSLILVLSSVWAGISLHPRSEGRDLSSTLLKGSQNLVETPAASSDKIESEELFTFGEPLESAIFLEIATPQAKLQPDIALTTAAIEVELSKHEDWPVDMVCFDQSLPTSLKDPAALAELVKDASHWERLISWMSLSFDRQYRVSLSSSSPQAEEYTLEVGEPAHLSDNFGDSTIVCEERT